jgi:hypothetical protein
MELDFHRLGQAAVFTAPSPTCYRRPAGAAFTLKI